MRFTPNYDLRDEANAIWDDAHVALGNPPVSADRLAKFTLGEYLRNLGGLIEDHPIPKNVAEQSSFNDAMTRYIAIANGILSAARSLDG